MKPKERVLAALMRKPTDRHAVVNPTSVACMELMDEVGVSFPEAHLDGKKMASLAAGGHTILGFDTVAPIFSIIQEAAGIGAEMDWGAKDLMPAVNFRKGPRWSEPEEIETPEDFLETEPIRAALTAIRELRRMFGDSVAILGKVTGPWTLAYHLFSTEAFLINLVLDPIKVRKTLERLSTTQIPFARAQVEAGADVIVWADHATSDLCRPESYRDFLLPFHKELPTKIGAPTILHICGRTTDRIAYIAQASFDCFHYDTKNDPAELLRIVDGRISLVGGINNPNTLYAGRPEDVKREAASVMKAGIRMIGPECAIPLQTPIENLRAIREAVEECQAGKLTG